MSNTPSETEIDNLLCKHWPAYSMQAVLVKMWLREAIKSAIAKWGSPQPVVREPLTLQQIAKAFAEAGLNPDDYQDDVMIEPLVRAIEAAHGITQKGGSNADT